MKKPKMIRRIKRMTLLMLKWRNESNAALEALKEQLDGHRSSVGDDFRGAYRRLFALEGRVFGGVWPVPENENVKPIQVQFDKVGGRIEELLGIVKDLRETIATYGVEGNKLAAKVEAAEQTLAAHSTIHDGMDTEAEAVEKALQTNQVQFKDVDDKFTKVHSFSCELADRIEDAMRRLTTLEVVESGESMKALRNRLNAMEKASDLQSAVIAKMTDTLRAYEGGPSYTMMDGEIVQLKGAPAKPWEMDAKVDSNIDQQYQLDALNNPKVSFVPTPFPPDAGIAGDIWMDGKLMRWSPMPFGLMGWQPVMEINATYGKEELDDHPPRWSPEYAEQAKNDPDGFHGPYGPTLENVMFNAFSTAAGTGRQWIDLDQIERKHWRAAAMALRAVPEDLTAKVIAGRLCAALEASMGGEIAFLEGAWMAVVKAGLHWLGRDEGGENGDGQA